MCGIVGFLSQGAWTQDSNLSWLDQVLAQVETALAEVQPEVAIRTVITELAGHFDELMSFSTHFAASWEDSVRQRLQQLAQQLAALETHLNQTATHLDPSPSERETLRDYAWQIRAEVLATIDRTLELFPAARSMAETPCRHQHFVAWALQMVLENLDRLEVRGRDSAGLGLQLTLPASGSLERLDGALMDELAERSRLLHAEHGSIRRHALADGREVYQFVYKVANLIGKLGDNGSALRAAIRSDKLLWSLATAMEHIAILAHTRWASNGIINLANCHPVNAHLNNDDEGEPVAEDDADVLAVLNGDVDNYQQLLTSAVVSRGYDIPQGIRTDAKIIPLLFRLDTDPQQTIAERVLATVRRLEGSIAVGFIHPDDPKHLHLAQKGSGQSLFLAHTHNGWLVASEVYGLAARARRCLPLLQAAQGGIQVTLASAPDAYPQACLMDTAERVELTSEPIEIFSRDIFRGDYDYYLEKEIHEAPSSVRKTLQGRYRISERAVHFTATGHKDLAPLIRRLQDTSLPPVRHIVVTGQGTASVAAMGTAYLIERALQDAPISVEWAKASELSMRLGNRSRRDTLVVAISQSGTTTDTNRTVDLARADGAWVHAILNRRNSPLVSKSDSRLFTSDGRDVEMAVASTKAFYGQIAAGKLTALCLGQTLGTLAPKELFEEILALESLPERIGEVINGEAAIAACAQAYAPRQRYWAVVGNGPNKIAAEEIRIKLSELCYRSIPCDFTEDKKHIDLSTEPLTLVIANDLPPLVAQDTAKEIAIFKAHSGKPIVFAASGESCFEPYAEALFQLPSVGAGLDFVIATVAGHLWGLHAAQAIDATAVPFRNAAALLATALDAPAQADFPGLSKHLSALLDNIAAGHMEAALPPHMAAQLGQYIMEFTSVGSDGAQRQAVLSRGIALLKILHDELSRPIDTIRHQAKTVTVGISRPQKDIAPMLRRALTELGVNTAHLAEGDKQLLITLSPFIGAVAGGALYRLLEPLHDWRDGEAAPRLQIVNRVGCSVGRASSYDQPRQAAGSKRRTLRLGRAALSTGAGGQENLLLLPVFDEQTWLCEGLALLHLEIIPRAALQQKQALLKALGRYEDALETFQDHQPAENFAMFLEALSPHALLFTPSFRALINDSGKR